MDCYHVSLDTSLEIAPDVVEFGVVVGDVVEIVVVVHHTVSAFDAVVAGDDSFWFLELDQNFSDCHSSASLHWPSEHGVAEFGVV